MTNSEEVKKEANELLDKGLVKEAQTVLVQHFKKLKEKRLPNTSFMKEANFLLSTVIRAVK